MTVPADDPPLTAEERARITPFVTDLDGPVFALTNLPEVVKGALFARYSRSPKGLRRLLVDEFLEEAGGGAGVPETGLRRAEALYDRVLAEYGDDSVAQLGAAHVAVEGASNLLTKVLEWGRLASYLEQSTRYVRLADQPGGRFRYHRPAGVMSDPRLAARYEQTLDRAFEAYARLIPLLIAQIDRTVPHDDAPPQARARAVGARALDALRGMLPAATTANVGIFGSGQAYEAMLVRMASHPLPEARECGERMLAELRKVIPAFLTRVDRPDRGRLHADYLAATRSATAGAAEDLLPAEEEEAPDGPAVRLVDFDPDGEERVVSHALWPHSGRTLAEVREAVRTMSADERRRALDALVGERADRRHRPGRALEATGYTFEVVCDYGAYRDLQRHRMLSLQAQPLTPRLGYDVPAEVGDAGGDEEYERSQRACAELYGALAGDHPEEAAYAVTLAHRLRFTMVMNARETMHVAELRSTPQGHPSYRWVAQEMHRQIAEVAGHPAIAEAMSFVDHSQPVAGRIAAERRQERRRRERPNGGPPAPGQGD